MRQIMNRRDILEARDALTDAMTHAAKIGDERMFLKMEAALMKIGGPVTAEEARREGLRPAAADTDTDSEGACA